jgi:hypothetical protein
MERVPKSRIEIERLVLDELQTCEDCEGILVFPSSIEVMYTVTRI